jgi:hypothetical protein
MATLVWDPMNDPMFPARLEMYRIILQCFVQRRINLDVAALLLECVHESRSSDELASLRAELQRSENEGR